jgi:D-beta-D-heptose 7-phosphate kinase/D-beta-D-heptose 1-phosphate adenosyltransferase
MEFLKHKSNINVLVVGDVMLDRYWWGSVSRISPEAPVPVVKLEKINSTMGGAANVAANIVGLGANVNLIGMIGDDAESEIFLDTLKTKNVSGKYLIKSKERQTIVKTRIIAHNQQIARVDQETKIELNHHEEESVGQTIDDLVQRANVIVLSDYGKGFLTDNIIKRLITKGRSLNKYVLIDPKGKTYKKYTGATMLTPNRYEASDAIGSDDHDQIAIQKIGKKLLSQLSLDYLLITQGDEGMTLFEKNKKAVHIPVEMRNVYDVTGAGDTVIACLAVAIGGGATFLEAAKFANRAAGLVVEQIGTTAISLEMLGL